LRVEVSSSQLKRELRRSCACNCKYVICSLFCLFVVTWCHWKSLIFKIWAFLFNSKWWHLKFIHTSPSSVVNCSYAFVALVHKKLHPRDLKRSYDKCLLFQDNYLTKFPWKKLVLGEDSLFLQVRCMICSIVEWKEKLSLKLNT